MQCCYISSQVTPCTYMFHILYRLAARSHNNDNKKSLIRQRRECNNRSQWKSISCVLTLLIREVYVLHFLFWVTGFCCFFWFPLPELNYLSGKGKGKTKQNKQKELTGPPRNLVNVNVRCWNSAPLHVHVVAIITHAHVQ